jgi:hypothetical protein
MATTLGGAISQMQEPEMSAGGSIIFLSATV